MGLPSPQLREYQEQFLKHAMEITDWSLDELVTPYEVYKKERYMKAYGGSPPPKKRTDDFIEEGDIVEAIRDGGRDTQGLPKDVPLKGRVYRVVRFYIASYGIGVVLANMDESSMDCYPYRGYVFAKMETVEVGIPGVAVTSNTAYFKKVE